MARRDPESDGPEDDERPPETEEPRGERRRSRLEGVIPDLIKKAVGAGYNTATGGADAVKQFIADSKLPKEIVNAIFQQIDETKNGLFRVVAKEIRGFLEAIDWQRELQRLLTTVSFEIKTEIRFIPNDSAPEKLGRPSVNAAMKVKRQREKDREKPRKNAETDEAAPVDANPEPPQDLAPPAPPGPTTTPPPAPPKSIPSPPSPSTPPEEDDESER